MNFKGFVVCISSPAILFFSWNGVTASNEYNRESDSVCLLLKWKAHRTRVLYFIISTIGRQSAFILVEQWSLSCHVMCRRDAAFHASRCNEAAFTLQIGYRGILVLEGFCFRFPNTSNDFPCACVRVCMCVCTPLGNCLSISFCVQNLLQVATWPHS